MTDDMVDTAGTLVAGAQFLKDRGAKKVYACATHGIFSPPAIERIEESALDSVIVTDTGPIDPLTKPERVTVLTVADILAETIHNVFSDDSVSAIFQDMNACSKSRARVQPGFGHFGFQPAMWVRDAIIPPCDVGNQSSWAGICRASA